jgi:hypothetical protein
MDIYNIEWNHNRFHRQHCPSCQYKNKYDSCKVGGNIFRHRTHCGWPAPTILYVFLSPSKEK